MIPQFMRKIGRVAQQRLQISHHGNDGASLTIAFVAIFDFGELIHHLVDVSAVLWQIEFSARVVVIVSHK